jgi:predicted transcriptional regulator
MLAMKLAWAVMLRPSMFRTCPFLTVDIRSAVEIRRSVFPDHLICLEDGAKLKTLKRHLSAEHGLTPEAYRAKWNLPANYPMVAPDYAKARSRMAKAAGLGRNAKTP